MMFRIVVQRDAKTIYSLLADLRGYQSWLPSSEMYEGLQEIAGGPVRMGTSYVDKGMRSVMKGRVTELEPNRIVALEQSMERKVLGVESRLVIGIR